MKKYEKYPEIFAIYQRTLVSKKKLVKNEAMIRDVKIKIFEFKHIAFKSNSRYKKELKKAIRQENLRYALALKQAKYIMININELNQEHDFELKRIEEEAKTVIDNRENKQQDEVKFLRRSFEICLSENRNLREAIRNSKEELKEKWNSMKSEIEAEEKIIVAKINKVKEENKTNILKIKKEYLEEKNDILEEYVKTNPEVKNFKIRLIRFKRIRKLKIKNDVDTSIYDLFVKLNNLKMQYKKNIINSKRGLLDLKLDLRYTKGKPDKYTFSKFSLEISLLSNKITNWNFLTAIRKAFFALMPFIFISSFFVLIKNEILSTSNGSFFNIFIWDVQQKEFLDKIKLICDAIYNACQGLFSLTMAAVIGYYLSYNFKIPKIITVILCIVTSIVMMPNVLFYPSGVTLQSFASNGLFVSIMTAIISVIIFSKLSKIKSIQINMPENAPKGISRAFRYLFPLTFTIMIFVIISSFIWEIGSMVGPISIYGNDVFTIQTFEDVVKALFSYILKNPTTSYSGMLLTIFLWQIVWFFGIHPNGVIAPILNPIQWDAIANNISGDEKQVFTNPFMNSFIHIGGPGASLILIIALLCLSKKRYFKTTAALALIPSLFNINEPILFGLPIVFNPMLFIPYVFGPLIWGSAAYFATTLGIMNYTTAAIAWTTPSFLMSYLSTLSWTAPIVFLFCSGLAFGIYAPFILMSNKYEKIGVVDQSSSKDTKQYNSSVIGRASQKYTSF